MQNDGLITFWSVVKAIQKAQNIESINDIHSIGNNIV